MPEQTALTGREHNIDKDSALISTSDLTGNINYCNDQLYNFTGYCSQDVIGNQQRMLGAGGVPPSVFSDLYSSLQANKAYIAVLKNRCKNGDHYWANVYFTPIYEQGKLAGIESIRSQPTAESVARAQKIYPKRQAAQQKRSVSDIWMQQGLHTKLGMGISALLTLAFCTLAYLLPDKQPELAITGAVTLLFSWLLISTMTRGLRQAASKSRSVIDNNLATLIYTGRQDEIGQLQLAIEVLQAKLKTALIRVSEAADDLVEQTAHSQTAVSNTQAEISRQEQEIDQIVVAMEQMSATVGDIAQNTLEASQGAEEADQMAISSKDTMQMTAGQITTLAQNIESAREVIQSLEQDSKAIGEIMTVIHAVAEQTNLLALNAAIEAARAGDQGRGFAVVADEVRSLAARTQGSVADIEEMIARLQTTTHQAVQVMSASTPLATGSVEQTNMAQTSLEQISERISQISNLNSMIASAAEEQSAVTNNITETINMIGQSAQSTSSHARENLESSSQLSNLTQRLHGIIRSFSNS
ncbi:methyl-accepting chemotaxis protein [Amphritea sp. HPY]|uniref:methyl-accepting chemotaxis protein n=1 Tax=Amphritea sp. HPY TaxID=3421652 RepID=UPI003D7C8D18